MYVCVFFTCPGRADNHPRYGFFSPTLNQSRFFFSALKNGVKTDNNAEFFLLLASTDARCAIKSVTINFFQTLQGTDINTTEVSVIVINIIELLTVHYIEINYSEDPGQCL